MNDPRITVIVPVYKVEPYLHRCVDSIRNQTYSNLEIILVDDGSPDRCGEMCDALAQTDSRIRVIHKENGGLSTARNAGLDAMTGEYVCFVDSDDWIAPDMCRVLLTRMVQQEAQISCCGIVRTDGENIIAYFCNARDTEFTLSREAAMTELNRNERITNSVCDKMYKAELFDGLRMKEGILYEDAQIQPYLLHRAGKITYTAEPLYCYFQSSDSILRSKLSVRHYDCITTQEERIAFFAAHYPQAVASARARMLELCLHFLYESYGDPQWNALRRDMLRIARQRPQSQTRRYISGRIRLKRLLLCVSEKLYVAFMDLYSHKRRNQHAG